MATINVKVGFTDGNFGAFVEELPGCVATGRSRDELVKNISEAINWHVKSSLEDDDPLPDAVKGEYSIAYHFSIEAILNYYKGIFTNPALEKITGVNQKQLHHYITGLKKPRPALLRKIEEG
ncbi:MAG: type II toxin-antitoxin system HicB family antitoxin, partial [Bacteroidota bacterium]